MAFKDFFRFVPSDRRAVAVVGGIAVIALCVFVAVDAIEGAKSHERALVEKERLMVELNARKDSIEAERRGREYGKGKRKNAAWSYGKRGGGNGGYGRSNGKRDYDYGKRNGEDERAKVQSNKFKELTKVDVNTADTALLRRIPGVGEKISVAIVNYRNRLGGFADVKQLLDVKIVSPELLQWFCVGDASEVKRIGINTASFQALNGHPYISYDQTKALLQFRRLYGDIRDAEHLRSLGIFNEEEVERLLPYLTF